MTITIVPRNEEENLYGSLIAKEQELRPRAMFFRVPGRFRGYTKWHHKKYDGWVWLRQAMNGVVVVEIDSKNRSKVWEILSAFIGFLDRYFKDSISGISINYPTGK